MDGLLGTAIVDNAGFGTGPIGGATQWAFFKLIFEFLDDEVEAFRDNMLYEMLGWISAVGLTLLTLWILIQGYRILTGRSHDSMMALMVDSARAVLIVGIAMAMAFGSTDLYALFTDGLPREIMQLVTGDDAAPADKIDQSLTAMQAAMIGIDALSTGGDVGLHDDKTQAQWLTGAGVAGPAIIGGALLLMYKIALALFVGFGPLFILSLLFAQTRHLFSQWLLYGLGTMFALAVLSFLVGVAMKMVFAAATAFAAQYAIALATGASAEGVSSLALQQGGMGLIMTVLIIIAPPMAAAFFRGTLGHFAAYSGFGVLGAARQGRSVQAEEQGTHQDTSASTTAAEHRHLHGQITAPAEDRIKSASEAEGSFLARHPHAVAALEEGGLGDPLPAGLQPVATSATTTTNSQPQVDTDGYIQNAGFMHQPVNALEKGPIVGPKAIIMHRTGSSTAAGTIAGFQKGVGTHFVIDKDGTIYQTASLLEKTAHVGKIKSRCFEEGTCSTDEMKTLESWGFAPSKVYNHEKVKEYPARYPMNEDSVGIEVVARNLGGDNLWEAPTPAQSDSVNKLVGILKDQYGMSDSDVYEHDKVSRKTPGEGAGLFDGDDDDSRVWVVPPRLPPP